MSVVRYTALAAAVLFGATQGGRQAVACKEKTPRVRQVAGVKLVKGILREWRGSQSGMTEKAQQVVRTRAEWERLWAQIRAGEVPPPPAPKIDWTNEMVLALFMGQRPTGGYGVAIQSVEYGTKEIVVRYEETAPPPDAITIQVLTQPWVAAVVKRSNLPVRFVCVSRTIERVEF